jgi:hypothetical protein
MRDMKLTKLTMTQQQKDDMIRNNKRKADPKNVLGRWEISFRVSGSTKEQWKSRDKKPMKRWESARVRSFGSSTPHHVAPPCFLALLHTVDCSCSRCCTVSWVTFRAIPRR